MKKFINNVDDLDIDDHVETKLDKHGDYKEGIIIMFLDDQKILLANSKVEGPNHFELDVSKTPVQKI